jgi:transposase
MVFLDNARYQKCAAVITLAKSLNIEWCHLPSYSPNLNLIERLWTAADGAGSRSCFRQQLSTSPLAVHGVPNPR